MCPDLCHLLPKIPEGCSSAQIFAVFPSMLVDLTGILLPRPQKKTLHKRPLTTKISKPCKILTHSNLCGFKTVPMSAGWTSVCYSCKHSSTKPHFPTFQGWSIPTLIPPSDPSCSLPPISPWLLGVLLPESEEDTGQGRASLRSAVPGHVPCRIPGSVRMG